MVEVELKCSGCNLVLARLIQTETNKERIQRGKKPICSKFKVIKCPKCSGESFWKTLDGTTSIGESIQNRTLDVNDTFIDKDGYICSVAEIR